jgi:hypothetical protein
MPRAMAQGVIRIAERTETVAALVTVWAAADTAVRIASATGACADGAVTAASSHGQSRRFRMTQTPTVELRP